MMDFVLKDKGPFFFFNGKKKVMLMYYALTISSITAFMGQKEM